MQWQPSPVSRAPEQVGEFVNTSSIEGFHEESVAPAELGWGTHERRPGRPAQPDLHAPHGTRHLGAVLRAVPRDRGIPDDARPYLGPSLSRAVPWTPLTQPEPERPGPHGRGSRALPSCCTRKRSWSSWHRGWVQLTIGSDTRVGRPVVGYQEAPV